MALTKPKSSVLWATVRESELRSLWGGGAGTHFSHYTPSSTSCTPWLTSTAGRSHRCGADRGRLAAVCPGLELDVELVMRSSHHGDATALRRSRGDSRIPCVRAITYLSNNASRMQYARYRRGGTSSDHLAVESGSEANQRADQREPKVVWRDDSLEARYSSSRRTTRSETPRPKPKLPNRTLSMHPAVLSTFGGKGFGKTST